MESMKLTINELSEVFNKRMAEFQQNLQSSSIPVVSPTTSNIAAQFNTFRTFVLTALDSLHKQLELLTSKCDALEMRSRRKIILMHGIPESKNEHVASVVAKVFSDHIGMPDINANHFSRCHRLGRINNNKPRPVLIKFKDATSKNKIWFAKTGLKKTGITMSEFLTKDRHKAFMLARQRYGINKCWTKDGNIYVIEDNGSRRCITSVAAVDAVPSSCSDGLPLDTSPPSTTILPNPTHKDSKVSQIRPKRVMKK